VTELVVYELPLFSVLLVLVFFARAIQYMILADCSSSIDNNR